MKGFELFIFDPFIFLVFFSISLSSCGDFNEEIIGSHYSWLKTNTYNHVVYTRTSDGAFKTIIDSNAVGVELVGKYIYAYRIESKRYDLAGIPPIKYGYHIISLQDGKVMRAVTFPEMVDFMGENDLLWSYSMCRYEGTIAQCLEYW